MTIFDEDNKDHAKNDSTNKTYIVQLKNNRYPALKPLKNNTGDQRKCENLFHIKN